MPGGNHLDHDFRVVLQSALAASVPLSLVSSTQIHFLSSPKSVDGAD